MITDIIKGNHANERSEAILPRKFQSSYSSAVEFLTMITDKLMENHANEHSEAILPRKLQSSYSNAVEFSNSDRR